MKSKIVILILLTFILTGCFDYVEINNLVIISGIGIDYVENEYEVSFELLLQNSEKDEKNSKNGNIRTAKGKSLAEAFDKLTLVIEKKPYFAHLKLLVISEDVAKDKLNEVFDFFLRSNDIRNIFSVIMSKDTTPKEILSATDSNNPVASERIKDLLSSNKYINYISQNKYFKNIVSDYIGKEKNICLTSIGIENQIPIIKGITIFDDEKPVDFLDEKDSAILSLINNKNTSLSFTIPCSENKKITIYIYKSKTKTNIEDNKFKIKNTLEAEIIENSCNIKTENHNDEEKITKDFEKEINGKTIELIKRLQEKNSDIIGINNKHYISKRKKNNKYFNKSKFDVETKININKTGLIYEVKND